MWMRSPNIVQTLGKEKALQVQLSCGMANTSAAEATEWLARDAGRAFRNKSETAAEALWGLRGSAQAERERQEVGRWKESSKGGGIFVLVSREIF